MVTNKILSENFGLKNVRVKKMFGPEKIWVQKNFEAKINLGSKNFLVRKILSPKKIIMPKKCWSKTLGQKLFESKKILGPKNFWTQKNLP